ncbi:MAG: discoidin domain-containing protein [Kiritimatiellaeota bacterium]|nr:discoidin domain-containing protein [Kiritimatiellota bacterium]
MKKRSIVFAVIIGFSAAVQSQENVPIKMTFPKPAFTGTPVSVKPYVHLDPYPPHIPRPPIFVPVGCDTLLSQGCKVTSSDPDPIIGELSYVTDGVKEYDMANYVELSPKLQWIQIDLGEEKEIHAVCIWHSGGGEVQRVYRDVICQISSDPKFADGVATVFNNDHDNSAGLGKDKEYIETHFGRPFAVDAVKGRYVRCYSRGNTSNEMNHYLEVEVFGRQNEREQKAEADNAEVRRKKAEEAQ